MTYSVPDLQEDDLKEHEDEAIERIFREDNPTDLAHFENIILTSSLKKRIIDYGPCRPKGPFPVDNNCRHFSEFYYSTITKNGQHLQLSWLCYSRIKNAVFCQPCWLFSRQESNWTGTGISDWQGLSKKIKLHLKSESHINSCFIYDSWKKNQTISETTEKEIESESKFWKQVLERLINITLMLAQGSLAFRGHRENINDVYSGNFLSTVKLLSLYDPVLQKVLTMPKGSIKYLSPAIQNEIVDCLATKLKRSLTDEIKSAPFFSIIIDTTQDISKVDQLSIVIRYVFLGKDSGSTSKLLIKESFLGFTKLEGQDASSMVDHITSSLLALKLDITNCRGQGYDGASVMSGAYTGVQKRIKDLEKTALYVHCAAHNLNLVVKDAVTGIKEIDSFFSILQDIYNFFGVSINRWDLLASITGESHITLKKLNPTRWASRVQSITAIKLRYGDVILALNKLIITSKKIEERNEASRLISELETFEFIFLCNLLDRVLGEINISSKMLQSPQLELSEAIASLRKPLKSIESNRNEYNGFKVQATEIAKNNKITDQFKSKRIPKVKKHFDELSEDHRLSNSEEAFKINVFYRFFDILLVQLNSRFQALFEIENKFGFIHPQSLCKITATEIYEKGSELQEFYYRDLSRSFPIEISTLINNSYLLEEIKKMSTVRELADFLLTNTTLSSSFAEVITACMLYLTLPVTVASAERSFNKLKLIKTFTRNTICQDRLHNLSILSIEAAAAKELDTEDLIKEFALKKSRRKELC